MKQIMTVLSVVFMFCTVSAQTNNVSALNILAKIQSEPSGSDLCANISNTNKLVELGDAATDTLISVLQNNSNNHVARWSAALALGEIGNPKASAILAEVAAKNSSDSHGFYLGDLARNAIGKIQGTVKKEGKFRKKTYAAQNTITDCETGDVDVVQ